MTPLEIIAVMFAAAVFIRGMAFIIAPRATKGYFLRLLSRDHQFFSRSSVLMLLFGLLIFYFIVREVPILHIIVTLVGSLFFVSGFAMLVAEKECKALWKALLDRPDRWFYVMGVAHVLVTAIILMLVYRR